ncbi:MAG: hypothetical protein LBO04_04180 [Spirochaetaceae bacterium]|nr:hypothetical protein [Spirochaetaceae bacterium]
MASAALPLYARDISVSVTDGDLEEPLAGAVIRLPDGAEIPTGDDGAASFYVPDDLYGEIRITYPGYEPERIVLTANGRDSFALTMRMSADVLENEELVIEEYRPEAGKIRSGRGVSMNRENLKITSEIGLIEDIISSIKLLPGVGYIGLFNALPSIRGGIPGDMKAALNGFYIDNPYHWGGGFSIFDPKTIESAQLYHGVFSARYTHTISGLLEMTSKRPPSDHVDFGLYLSTSAAGFNVSHPLPDFSDFNAANRGAVMVTGKLTYWGPFVNLAKALSKSIAVLEPVNAVSVAPYIRSLNLLSNYRFSADMELNLNAYVGSDGVGASYDNTGGNIDVLSYSTLKFAWDNIIFFFTANLLFNPKPDMIIKTNLGVSYGSQFMDSYTSYTIEGRGNSPDIHKISIEKYKDTITGLQARVDFDRDLGNGFLFSAGVEELYRKWYQIDSTNAMSDVKLEDGTWQSFVRVYPEVHNTGLFSGAYSLFEYEAPAGRFSVEAGLRLDHLYFIGNDFTVQTFPVLNPRLNFDYYLLRNRKGIDLLTLTAGTGLFSSLNENIAYLDKSYGINDFDLKQNRSSTSIAGIKIDFLSVWSLMFEFYYKYIFDRAYITSVASFQKDGIVTEYDFDGTGHVWGFDIMLQKIYGRFIDGWISYSFNYAKYHDPKRISAFMNAFFSDMDNTWYFPSFHRFSTLNLVLNIKPLVNFNIYMRFGFASGFPQADTGPVFSYELYDGKNRPTGIIKYKRESFYSDNVRSGFSLPLDIKFSWYFFYPNDKVRTEVYLAAENVLSLIYRSKRNTTLNPYTGEEEEGSDIVSFELPIPMVSFGFMWTY